MEGLDAAQAADAHGADLEDRALLGREPRGLEIDDDELRRRERPGCARPFDDARELSHRDAVGQALLATAERGREDAPRHRGFERRRERKQSLRQLGDGERRVGGVQTIEHTAQRRTERERHGTSSRGECIEGGARRLRDGPPRAKRDPARRGATVFAMRARLLLLLALCSASADAIAALPSVARARYEGRDAVSSGTVAGTVFFLQTKQGPVAVGVAHSFDRARLAAAPELVFERGRTRKRIASATRVLVEPGLAFAAPGGSLRTDLVVFALDAPPDARVLEAGKPPREGDRVRLLGIPGSNPHDEDDLFGTVRSSDQDRLEVELDVFADLRGWGGAPIVSKPDDRVIGVVQAATPSGKTLRITATPIASVTATLARPLEGGRGRGFAALGADMRRAAARRTRGRPRSPSRSARRRSRSNARRSVCAISASRSRRPETARSSATSSASSSRVARSPPTATSRRWTWCS